LDKVNVSALGQQLDHADLYRAAHLLADCHQGAARCLLPLGDQPAALDHARQVARLLERWPGWRRDEAAALLRRLGDGPPAADGPGDLTPREREVAALLAEASPTARSPAASTSPPRPPRCTSPTS
jgi:hypothetical protein